jgi:hypothetical protein
MSLLLCYSDCSFAAGNPLSSFLFLLYPGQLTEEDEDEVLKELEALAGEGFDEDKLPEVPSDELPGSFSRLIFNYFMTNFFDHKSCYFPLIRYNVILSTCHSSNCHVDKSLTDVLF